MRDESSNSPLKSSSLARLGGGQAGHGREYMARKGMDDRQGIRGACSGPGGWLGGGQAGHGREDMASSPPPCSALWKSLPQSCRWCWEWPTLSPASSRATWWCLTSGLYNSCYVTHSKEVESGQDRVDDRQGSLQGSEGRQKQHH